MSKIQVKNESGQTVRVAINSWGDGSSDFFSIHSGKSGSWNRSDSRGFILCVGNGNSAGTYYVLAGQDVVISETDLTGAEFIK